MVKASFSLEKGLTIGDVTHKDVELEELNVGEILKAEQYAEEVRVINGEAVIVTSPAKLGMELLRLQIKKLGTLKMPLSAEEFSLLSRADLTILQAEARKLDAAVLAKVAARGRGNQGASGDVQSS